MRNKLINRVPIVVYFSESISALIGANPMLTKRNRCTVQTSSVSSADGVCDLVAAEISERLNTENSVAQRLEFDADVYGGHKSEHDAHESLLQNSTSLHRRECIFDKRLVE